MFGHNKKPVTKVKSFSAFTRKGLEHEINRFGKKHQIINVEYSSATSASNNSAMVTYQK